MIIFWSHQTGPLTQIQEKKNHNNWILTRLSIIQAHWSLSLINLDPAVNSQYPWAVIIHGKKQVLWILLPLPRSKLMGLRSESESGSDWLCINWWTRCDCCRFVDASGEFVAELYIKKMKKLLDFGRRALFYIRVLSGYEERKIRNHRLQLEQRLRQVLGFYYVFRFISVLNVLFLLNCSEFHLLQSPWVAYNNNCSCILNNGEFFQAFW